MGNLGVQRLALRCRGLGPRSGCRQRSSKTTSQPAMAAASGACKSLHRKSCRIHPRGSGWYALISVEELPSFLDSAVQGLP